VPSIGSVDLYPNSGNPAPTRGLCLFVLLYAAFIAVAIWRSANNYGGWVAWRALAKGSVLVVFLHTAVQLAGS